MSALALRRPRDHADRAGSAGWRTIAVAQTQRCAPPNRASRTAIAFRSDRPDAPRAGDAYGDATIAPVRAPGACAGRSGLPARCAWAPALARLPLSWRGDAGRAQRPLLTAAPRQEQQRRRRRTGEARLLLLRGCSSDNLTSVVTALRKSARDCSVADRRGRCLCRAGCPANWAPLLHKPGGAPCRSSLVAAVLLKSAMERVHLPLSQGEREVRSARRQTPQCRPTGKPVIRHARR